MLDARGTPPPLGLLRSPSPQGEGEESCSQQRQLRGTHEQAIWPLPWQPTLDAFSDDELAGGAYRTLLILACGAVLLLAALFVPVPSLGVLPVGSHLPERSDGDPFWLLTDGVTDDDHGMTMPGFAGRLSAGERWALIDYVRALAGAEPDGNAAPAHHHH